MKLSRQRLALVAAPALVAGLIAAVVLLAGSDKSGRTAVSYRAFAPDTRTLPSCNTADLNCRAQAYGNLSWRKGPESALTQLRSDLQAGRVHGTACHGYAHKVGEAGMLRPGGDTAEVLSADALLCGGGYYHGAMVAALAGTPASERKERAQTLCDGTAQSAELGEACSHGLGHAMIVYEGNNVDKTLAFCRGLQRRGQVACEAGVFMESFDGETPRIKGTVAEPFAPCTGLAKHQQSGCLLQVAPRVVREQSGNWSRTATLCSALSASPLPGGQTQQRSCFTSLARVAARDAPLTLATLTNVCARAEAFEPGCLGVGVFSAVRTSTAVCLTEGASSAGCADAVEQRLRKLVPPSDLHAACEPLGGAGGTLCRSVPSTSPS